MLRNAELALGVCGRDEVRHGGGDVGMSWRGGPKGKTCG